MKLILLALTAAVAAQVPNLIGVRMFSPNSALQSIVKITLIASPAAFIACSCYIYYFSTGIHRFSYASLTLVSFGATMIIAALIQWFVLKNGVSQNELVGGAIITLGVAWTLYGK